MNRIYRIFSLVAGGWNCTKSAAFPAFCHCHSYPCYRHSRSLITVIPAPLLPSFPALLPSFLTFLPSFPAAPLPSFPRRRESGTVRTKTIILPIGHFWIPAYAGMTVGGGAAAYLCHIALFPRRPAAAAAGRADRRGRARRQVKTRPGQQLGHGADLDFWKVPLP